MAEGANSDEWVIHKKGESNQFSLSLVKHCEKDKIPFMPYNFYEISIRHRPRYLVIAYLYDISATGFKSLRQSGKAR